MLKGLKSFSLKIIHIISHAAKMEKIYGMHKLVGLQLFWSGTPTFSIGTPTFRIHVVHHCGTCYSQGCHSHGCVLSAQGSCSILMSVTLVYNLVACVCLRS